MYKVRYSKKVYQNIGISNINQKGGNLNDIVEAVNNGVVPGKSNLTQAGTGVFSKKDFKQGEILEIVPVLSIPIKDVTENILKDYVFQYDDKSYGMVLGYGAVYNHQDIPNVSYEYSNKKDFMIYKATQDIKEGDELFVSYGIGWWNHRNLTPVNN